MLTRNRRKWIVIASVAAIGAIAAIGSGTVASAQSTSDWGLSPTQAAQARQALMLVGTQSDPSNPTAAARVTGSWPENIASGRAIGTDRSTALTAMGEPQKSPAGATKPVVCAEGHGKFSTANMPHPAGSPTQTYTYAVVCFDPSTGDILDTGYDNKPLAGNFSNAQALNVIDRITNTVR
ncbi:hypothetical protein [Gryllotalpicola protaetiae]|nr:hypothetical protein [Gryllotalpicola protaetiae]